MSDPLLPIRILAGIALFALLVAFVYVLRHLRQIEQTVKRDNLVPANLGPRNNLVLMVCLVPVIVTALLVFLVLKA